LLERWLLERFNHWVAGSVFVSKQAILFTSSFPDLIIACGIVALWFSNGFETAFSFKIRCKILLMFFSFVPTYILARLSQSIFPRPRPMISIPLEMTTDLKSWNSAETHFSHWDSFPSDHAALFFIFNIFVFNINSKLGYLSLIFTTYCSFFRIGTGYQWPSDIIGGALLGSSVSLLILSMEYFLKNVLISLVLQFKRYSMAAYTISFLFLSDFAQDFHHLRLIASLLFNIGLFH
jgi:undecaprenyl-diphosphatase